MSNVVVVGSQWGDEGKGKIVDWLSEKADVVARFQGGHNAGHTLVVNNITYKLKNVVLDPVMVAKGGTKLINNSSVKYLKKLLLPLSNLVTPNIPEAEALTGYTISNKEDMIKAAKKILNMGSKNVLLKGGHLKSKMIFDILATKKGIRIFAKRKIKTKNTHGTGCTLSSALATCLSQKKNIVKSCKISLRYVDKAIISAPGYGKGFGPLNHLVSFNLKNINV